MERLSISKVQKAALHFTLLSGIKGRAQCCYWSKQVHSLLLGTADVSCALVGANHLMKDNDNETALDNATGPLRRLLLKNCGKGTSAAAVALAVKAEAELLALLEAEAQAARQPKKKKKKKKGGKEKEQQPQPKQKHKVVVVVKEKAAAAPVKLMQSPRVLCEIAVNLHQAELPSKPKKHHLAVPLQECSNRLIASVRPAPIVTSNKVEVPTCTVLANSTQTIEESEHQRSMQQLRMELEAAHRSSIQQLRTELMQVAQEYQSSMQQLESQHQSAMQQLESQSKLAQQENDQLRAKTECAVCLDGERDAVLFPCMHASCCHKCSASLEQCPQCRSPVTQMMRIYSP